MQNETEQKLLQRFVVYAAAIVALAGVMFTVGFFVGRASGGTDVKVYMQNPEGVYVAAQTTVPEDIPEVRLLMPEEESPSAAVSTAPASAFAPAMTSTVIRPASTTTQTTPQTSVASSTVGIASTSEATSSETSSPETTTAAETTTQTSAATTSETTTTTTAPETTTIPETTRTTTQAATPGIVNVNTATQSQLETLPGIGPVKAASIIEYRKEHGAFQSVDDLINVSGIGKKTLADIRPYVTVG